MSKTLRTLPTTGRTCGVKGLRRIEKALMPQGRIGERTGSPLFKSRRGSRDHSAIRGIENYDDSSKFRLLLCDFGVTLLQEKLGVLQPLLGPCIFLRFVDLLDR